MLAILRSMHGRLFLILLVGILVMLRAPYFSRIPGNKNYSSVFAPSIWPPRYPNWWKR